MTDPRTPFQQFVFNLGPDIREKYVRDGEMKKVVDTLFVYEEFTKILVPLAVDNPWSWSQEGLDDCCMFCDSELRSYRDGRFTYEHERGCSWLEAREFLGLVQPEHARRDVR